MFYYFKLKGVGANLFLVQKLFTNCLFKEKDLSSRIEHSFTKFKFQNLLEN